jgi:hypothetical protein
MASKAIARGSRITKGPDHTPPAATPQQGFMHPSYTAAYEISGLSPEHVY